MKGFVVFAYYKSNQLDCSYFAVWVNLGLIQLLVGIKPIFPCIIILL